MSYDRINSLLLKSRDATYTSSTYAETYIFPIVSNKLAGRYRVSAVSCGINFYNVTSSNNTVYTSLGNATLTSGYYSASTFTTMLDTRLKVVDANFAATYSSDTKKITVTNTGAFTLNFATTTNTAAYLMGFALSNTASATSQVADYPVNLVLSPSILLGFVDADDNISGSSQNSTKANVYLPLNNVSYGSYVSWYHRDLPQYLNFSSSVSNKIKVLVMDGQGNPLNLQRADLEILLEAEPSNSAVYSSGYGKEEVSSGNVCGCGCGCGCGSSCKC